MRRRRGEGPCHEKRFGFIRKSVGVIRKSADATSTPMKLKRAMRHAIELDDDVVEAIFLHVMSVEEVGRLSQASIQFRRVAATAMVQA